MSIFSQHSISAIKTNLSSVEAEQDLRSSLVRKLARGCVFSGSGNIFVLEDKQQSNASLLATATGAAMNTPSTLCYYCLVRDEGEEKERDTPSGEESNSSSSEFLVKT